MRGCQGRRRRPAAFVLVALMAWILALPAGGQDPALDAPDPAPAAQTGGGGSLVTAFFISRKTDPVTSEERVEVLGSMVIWLLLCLSMLSIGLIGHMALTNQRKSILAEGVAEEVTRLLKAGKYREVIDMTRVDKSFFSQLIHAGLREANHGFTAVIRAMEQTSDEMTTNRLRRIEYLNVLGQVSPMIGLFGTVYGMILAFQAIVLTGGDADPILLAGGISTALTTTFWGLVVAIPALAGYAIIRNRIDGYTTEATLAAEELLNQFRPRPGGRSAPVPDPGGGTASTA
jgi:biopolymer transport protein ExbB